MEVSAKGLVWTAAAFLRLFDWIRSKALDILKLQHVRQGCSFLLTQAARKEGGFFLLPSTNKKRVQHLKHGCHLYHLLFSSLSVSLIPESYLICSVNWVHQTSIVLLSQSNLVPNSVATVTVIARLSTERCHLMNCIRQNVSVTLHVCKLKVILKLFFSF